MIGTVCVLLTEVGVTNLSVTPTVELNALAMKRGELAVYRPIEHKTAAPAQPYCIQTYNFRGGYFNRRCGKSDNISICTNLSHWNPYAVPRVVLL